MRANFLISIRGRQNSRLATDNMVAEGGGVEVAEDEYVEEVFLLIPVSQGIIE